MEEGLASLRSELLPQSKRNFDLYSQGYVDMIVKLKAEIDEYFAAHPELCAPAPGAEADANGETAAEGLKEEPSGVHVQCPKPSLLTSAPNQRHFL